MKHIFRRSMYKSSPRLKQLNQLKLHLMVLNGLFY